MSLVLISQLFYQFPGYYLVIIISFIVLGIPLNLKTHTKQRPLETNGVITSKPSPLHGGQVTQGGMKFIDDLRRVPGKNEFHGTVFFSGKSLKKPYPQMLHVWNIYLHLAYICGKCIGKYSLHGAYGIDSCCLIPWVGIYWLFNKDPYNDFIKIPTQLASWWLNQPI